ncbi:MAG: glycosyltransferase family 39 protein [Flavobacteriales bacterium]
MSQQRSVRFILPALIIANAVIKLIWLGRTELAHDEPFTVYWSQQPLADLWAMLATENNPPLFFLLIKGWSAMVPFEVTWLRIPSALFSALAVWPLFLLGRAVGGFRPAVVASLLFIFCNYHYGFAHEVRGYSLFTLLAIGVMWQTWRCAHSGGRALFWLVLSGAAMTYTHFFGWLMLGVVFLCVALVRDLRPARRTFFIALGFIALLYLPYGAIFLGRLGTSVEHGTWLTAPEPEELYNMIWRWSNAPVIAVIFLVIIIGSIVRSRARGAAMGIGLLWTFVPLFGMYLASYVTPIFLDRYLVYAAPGFALLVATCLSTIATSRNVTIGLCAAAILGMGVTFTPWKDTGRHPSRVVAQAKAWCDPVSCSTEVLPPWYWLTYLAAQDIDLLRENNAHFGHPGSDPQLDGGSAHPEAPPDTTTNAVVVNAGADLVDPERLWFRRLKAIYPVVDSVEADHQVWVYRFSR